MSAAMTMPRSAGARVPILAAASFATATQSFVFAGLLAEMAADLRVTVAAAGQVGTVYALAFGLSAPVVAAILARRDRRQVMVAALVALAAINLVIVASAGFPALIGLRVAAGIASAAVVPAATASAVALSPPERRGRAIAVVVGGTTLAFLLGIPAGSVMGDLVGWRGCFAFAAAIALLAALAIRMGVPPVAGDAGGAAGGLAALGIPGVAPMLVLNLVAFCAVFAVAAYIGPVTNQVSGLTGSGVAVMQALVGVASIAGLPLGAWLADRGRFGLAALLPLGALAGNLLQAGLLAGLAAGTALALPLQAVAVLASAGSLFALGPVVTARLAVLAPQARGFILACNASAIFLGQAGGAALGGLGIWAGGLAGAALAGALIGLPALWLARGLRRHPPS
jgi:predicted MFS family arabinose efflux permease